MAWITLQCISQSQCGDFPCRLAHESESDGVTMVNYALVM